MGVQGLRVEIVSDAPPPPDEPPYVCSLPPRLVSDARAVHHRKYLVRHVRTALATSSFCSPPPVTEMPATFNLELVPGQHIALETTVSSADEVDMARMEDGTVVDGMFWGKLNIVHSGDNHTVEFTGTKMRDPDITPEFLFDSRVMTKLTTAARPLSAKCHLSILAPAQQYCDVILTVNPLWSLTMTWPPAENVGEHKHKYFLRVHPGGALEHFESEMVVTSLYYEAV